MSDYKLNKYLAKLKNAQDLKKANVYIAKILKYKQMGGQKGGDGPTDDIKGASTDLQNFAGRLDEMKDAISGDQAKINGLMEQLIIPPAAGNGVDPEKLKDELKVIFGETKTLLENIGILNKVELPKLEDLFSVIQTKLREKAEKGETEIDLKKIIDDAWNEAAK